MLDAWAAVIGVSGPLGTTAPAGLTASGAGAAAGGFGALEAPALRSLEAGVLAEEGLTLPVLPVLPELLEGLGVVAQPASQAVTTTVKSDVMFMCRNRGNRDLAVGQRWVGGGLALIGRDWVAGD